MLTIMNVVSRSLNREEMKKVMGGRCENCDRCRTGSCKYYAKGQGEVEGTCGENSRGKCVCAANDGKSSVVLQDCYA